MSETVESRPSPLSSAPTVKQIREALLAAGGEYCRLQRATGGDLVSLPKLARAIVNDKNFFRRVESGENFTINSYEQIMEWLDKHWPEGPVADAGVA